MIHPPRGLQITAVSQVPRIGAMSFCRHCRGVVWSGDSQVFFATGMGGHGGEIGDYYAHQKCQEEREAAFMRGQSVPGVNPLPRIYSVEEFRELVARILERRAVAEAAQEVPWY